MFLVIGLVRICSLSLLPGNRSSFGLAWQPVLPLVLGSGKNQPFLFAPRWTQPVRWRSWRQTVFPCSQQHQRAPGEDPGSRSS